MNSQKAYKCCVERRPLRSFPLSSPHFPPTMPSPVDSDQSTISTPRSLTADRRSISTSTSVFFSESDIHAIQASAGHRGCVLGTAPKLQTKKAVTKPPTVTTAESLDPFTPETTKKNTCHFFAWLQHLEAKDKDTKPDTTHDYQTPHQPEDLESRMSTTFGQKVGST